MPDVAKERDFYTSLLGTKVVSNKADEVFLRFGQNTLVLRPAGSDGKPDCHEFGFVVQNYNETKVKAELDRRGLSPKKSSFGGWALNDLNGLVRARAQPSPGRVVQMEPSKLSNLRRESVL